MQVIIVGHEESSSEGLLSNSSYRWNKQIVLLRFLDINNR